MISLEIDVELSQKLIVSLFIGILIGFERSAKEREKYHFGPRSAALVTILGTIASHFYEFSWFLIPISAILIAILLVYYLRFRFERQPGFTTALSIGNLYFIGIIIGFGYISLGIIVGVLVLFLLAEKEALTQFVKKIEYHELKSAIQLALLALLIYPVIPDIKDPIFASISTRRLYELFLVVLFIMFLGYIFMRKYGKYGIFIFSFVGSLVNSEATTHTISKHEKSGEIMKMELITCIFISISGMIVRNLFLIILFGYTLINILLLPFLSVMALDAFNIILVLLHSKSRKSIAKTLSLPPPYEMKVALKFTLIFFTISLLTLFLLQFGYEGVLIAAIVGGLINSGATITSFVAAYSSGVISYMDAAYYIVLTTISANFNKIIFAKLGGASKRVLMAITIENIILAILMLFLFNYVGFLCIS